jgi:Fic family protein
MKEHFILKELPLEIAIETKPVLKQLSQAHRYLAELKGISKTIPNQGILINTLPLLEAKDSSAIENIITTHDELYKESLFGDLYSNASAKEVQNYSRALRSGYETVQKTGLLTNRQILEIQECIEQNRAGFRTQSGTELVNDLTGEIVYVPPQSADDVLRLMGNLEKYINDDSMSSVDSLIKMAVIHFQFESIHPFYDGNGRTGRILNILYLVHKGLLDIPVLYLSRYIIRNKASYYTLIQDVRDSGNWESWILFMLTGIEQTAKETIDLVISIRELMDDYKQRLKDTCHFYSQDLLNNLFSHPYTKIEFLEADLGIHRQTASKYLKELAAAGFLRLEKIGKHHFYINEPLFNLFIIRA